MIGYTDEAALTAYATARGITLESAPAVLLTKALDYLETLEWIGVKTDPDQALSWPRADAYVDGYMLPDDTVPAAIAAGQHSVAIAIDQGNDPLAPVARKTKREKVDVIEVEYADDAAAAVLVRSYNAILRKYLRAGGGIGTFEVIR